ncbi:MAG: cytochrome c biogenesis protein [Saprospiraceae bacterium]|jgi:heme exporter protein C
MLRQNWWKALAVILLAYTIIAGMLMPLKPGIVRAEPSSARAGTELQLEVQGYNTRFTAGGAALRAWLKAEDGSAISATAIRTLDDKRLSLKFSLPLYLPVEAQVKDMALLLDDPVNGAIVLPSAVFITQAAADVEKGRALWGGAQIAGLHEVPGFHYPFRNILKETIRNTYFHVPLWFAMLFLFLYSMLSSIRYLRHQDEDADARAKALTSTGILFGLLGLVTGAIWAKNTWGAYWSWDVKQNMTVIALLIYMAYFILRGAFEDQDKSARLGAVYNIFAFGALVPLIYVVPRLTDSLHPGAGGNPAFGSEDLDNTMRMVFYPAILGWTLLGFWIASLAYRAERLQRISAF